MRRGSSDTVSSFSVGFKKATFIGHHDDGTKRECCSESPK